MPAPGPKNVALRRPDEIEAQNARALIWLPAVAFPGSRHRLHMRLRMCTSSDWSRHQRRAAERGVPIRVRRSSSRSPMAGRAGEPPSPRGAYLGSVWIMQMLQTVLRRSASLRLRPDAGSSMVAPPAADAVAPVLARNIAALRDRREKEESNATRQEKLAELITRFTGSM